MIILPSVELVRLEENFDVGTLGALKINKQLFCNTLEPADLENRQNVSSIPSQQYVCEKYNSPRFGETFIVTNVPDRSKILFHSGNFKKHTEGCILLGSSVGKLNVNNELRGIMNSGETFRKFFDILSPYDRFILTIAELY